MKIIGITGSIASGKSYVCNLLRQKGFHVFESDLVVANLFTQPEIQNKILETFPNVEENNKVNKQLLVETAFAKGTENLLKLEKVFHPEVIKLCKQFILDHKNEKFIFIEAPLLFESNMNSFCNKIIAVCTEKGLQQERALNRQGINNQKLSIMLQRQMPAEKIRALADYIIDSKNVDNFVEYQLDEILKKLELL